MLLKESTTAMSPWRVGEDDDEEEDDDEKVERCAGLEL
jgi:hypothetical protein